MSLRSVLIAAPGSDSGKTTITCALLQALKDRGLDTVSFKCGPDYIDPLFHKRVLGVDSRNLDTFFAGKEGVWNTAAKLGNRYAVIEGVMGLYDGRSTDGIDGSGYEIAETLNAPIVLIVNASGTGRTIISIIKGMLLDDTEHLIKGVILNKISAGFYESLKPSLEKELSAMREDVKLLGCFPKNAGISIGSRHLGLMMPDEISDLQRMISDAASILEENADVDGIISIMEDGKADQPIVNNKSSAVAGGVDDLTLAVAYDEAFCFYYADNFDILRENGVKLQFFSPIHDEKLPDNIDGILLGGGYPENYLEQLSSNKSMLASIKEAINKDIPSLAECGGFMYLHNSITDTEGKTYDMAGVIDGECRYTGHLVRFGYMQIESAKDLNNEALLYKSLVGMKGHEFHYYDSTFNGNSYIAGKPGKDKKWDCIVTCNNGVWGFPHFYYRSNPEFIKAFTEKMKLHRQS
ncbi:cobyrinate a,c-diamide synthase [Butyrivibrio sp. VCB2006]|uniref:cobyrinate a,c-diamide synthase n=1 Tax=Butyrivibrio sp. VCB2006 TaxID=1280679 RepID=UPI0004297BDE|nr:cobyrinate a,c-diamide synthase [Butyrivibrio sp. VCB2006]